MRADKSTRVAIFVLVVLALGFFLYRQWQIRKIPGQLPLTDSRCLPLNDAWNHVYRPERLEVIRPCVAARGTVAIIRPEADGDLHVLLALDSGQDKLLDQRNIDGQRGDLVAEVICARSVRQVDAVDACADWETHINLHRGEHVRVTGAYVLDREHGWMELHPVSNVEELAP